MGWFGGSEKAEAPPKSEEMGFGQYGVHAQKYFK